MWRNHLVFPSLLYRLCGESFLSYPDQFSMVWIGRSKAGIIFVQPAEEFLRDEEDLSADDGPSKSNTRKNP